jgi:lipopolysaccharide biosynthesis glycosyltransferase
MKLYDLAGATARPFVTTTLTNERTRGTWNSGVVPLRRSAGIAVQWREVMLRLLTDDFAPREAVYLRENNVLSAVATAHYDRFVELPVAYNYPVQNWDTMTARGTPPEEAVLWHYQPFLDKTFRKFAARIDAARSLEQRIKLTESLVDDLRVNYRKRIGLDETRLQSWRRRLQLGPRVRRFLGR